jgi:hypothetical protein
VTDVVDALYAAGTELRILSAAVVLFGAGAVGLPLGSAFLYASVLNERGVAPEAQDPLLALLMVVALFVGFVAFLVVFVQIPLLIIASVGGRLSGEPLSLRRALRRSRQVFLRGLGAVVVVSVATGIPTAIGQRVIIGVLGPTELAIGFSLLAGAVFASPWVYVLSGIVLGGVATAEAIRRSWQLARFRWRIAVTIAFLAVVGQFIVLAAAESALGLVLEVGFLAAPGTDITTVQPAVALVVSAVGLVLGTSILFGVQLVQFGPQASGFYALTRYTAGLDGARGGPPEPLVQRRALVFYGVGILAGLVLLVRTLSLLSA